MQTFTPPAEQTRLIGHHAAGGAFRQAWQTGRMPHAWLLTGQGGIGKATFAYHAARWVLAVDRPPETLVLPASHRSYGQIAADAHPSLLAISAIEGDKGVPLAISVTQVRGGKDERAGVSQRFKGIGEFLQLTPADGGWRVVLIDGAEQLNEQAQNAVLKLLEEPPPQVLLLLTSAQPGRLLPTIRSRCRMLRMQALSEIELRELARSNSVQTADTEIAAAQGSIGELARLSALDAEKLDSLLRPLLTGFTQPGWRIDWQSVHELGTLTSRKGAEAQFDLLLELMFAQVIAAARNAPALSREADLLQQRMLAVRQKYLQPGAALIEIFNVLQRMSTLQSA